MAITPDIKVSVSEELLAAARDEKFRKYLSLIDEQEINSPSKFSPNNEFFDMHYQKYVNR